MAMAPPGSFEVLRMRAVAVLQDAPTLMQVLRSDEAPNPVDRPPE